MRFIKLASLLVAIAFVVTVAGCGVPKDKYNALLNEKVALEEKLNVLTQARDAMQKEYDVIVKEKVDLATQLETAVNEKAALKVEYDKILDEKVSLKAAYDKITGAGVKQVEGAVSSAASMPAEAAGMVKEVATEIVQ